MEFMKIVHMGVNNPHLKPKPGGYFSSGNVAVSAAASAATAAVVSAAAATGTSSSAPHGTASGTIGDNAHLLKQRTALEPPLSSSSALVHFEFESDILLSRNPLTNVAGSSASASASAAAAVEEAMDDSPTAELLPNSGQKL